MCHGFELHGNLIRHITKENVSFSTTLSCRSKPIAATKRNRLVYVIKPTSLVFLDGFLSTVVDFNALRNGSVSFLNKFVLDMNTASYQYDGAISKARNYILEFLPNSFHESYLFIYFCKGSSYPHYFSHLQIGCSCKAFIWKIML
jgi:hypothetical protein